jgi:hypothetical protein
MVSNLEGTGREGPRSKVSRKRRAITKIHRINEGMEKSEGRVKEGRGMKVKQKKKKKKRKESCNQEGWDSSGSLDWGGVGRVVQGQVSFFTVSYLFLYSLVSIS